MQQIQMKAHQDPALAGVFSNFSVGVPQLFAHLDRTKAQQLGVDVQDVFSTMQTYLGSVYINDFNRFGRTYEVIAQADTPFRSSPQDIAQLKVRNNAGQMVPLGSLVNVSETTGPDTAMRYNGFRAADLNGAAAPGFSSGQAQAAITKILDETLPKGMRYEWTDLTYQQILAGDTALLVFPLCVLLVFLVLAAQYESLFLPLAIILIVPMCLFSAITGVWLTGGDNNIFTQIGLFVLIGLACKNAILIVEFARELEIGGEETVKAAIHAARLRLRPILMTSIAFIAGVTPLALAHGAGAGSQNAIGTGVVGGMITATILAIFFVPVFYQLINTRLQHHK
jgi:multidrug efflux pump